MGNDERLTVKGLVIHRHQGRSKHRFVCQVCDAFITDAQGAVILWERNRPDSGAVVVHKLCQSTHELLRDSEELDTALAFILSNSRMDSKALARAQEKARSASEL